MRRCRLDDSTIPDLPDMRFLTWSVDPTKKATQVSSNRYDGWGQQFEGTETARNSNPFFFHESTLQP
jgi:hypothetical protein